MVILYLIMSVITIVGLRFGVDEQNRRTTAHNLKVVHRMLERPLIDTDKFTVWIGLVGLALFWPITLMIFVLYCIASVLANFID